MKLGILTYHRAENYGSVLQCYALSKYLNSYSQNVNAVVIDFFPAKQKEMHKLFDKKISFKSILRNVIRFFYLKQLIEKKNKFKKFIYNYLPLTPISFSTEQSLKQLNDDFDLFICGSDQIWNPNCYDFSDAYLLSFVEDDLKKNAYAPSFGCSKLNPDFVSLFKTSLKRFNHLSARESDGIEIIHKLTKKKATLVPDPVFLIQRNEWEGLLNKPLVKRKYILCYFIGNAMGMRTYAKMTSKKLKMPIVCVNFNLRDFFYFNNKKYNCGPIEFLNLLYFSQYIISDSFHATSFSLIFKKNFTVFIKEDADSTNSRIISLLSYFDLENRIYNYSQSFTAETKYPKYFDTRLLSLENEGVKFINLILEGKK